MYSVVTQAVRCYAYMCTFTENSYNVIAVAKSARYKEQCNYTGCFVQRLSVIVKLNSVCNCTGINRSSSYICKLNLLHSFFVCLLYAYFNGLQVSYILTFSLNIAYLCSFTDFELLPKIRDS